MDLFSLRCFVEIVRCGGFSRAAEKVGRTQPAISAQIKNLEDLAGGALFDRSVSKPVLTQKGRALLPRAEKLVADFDALVQVMGNEQVPQGVVTLAAGQTIIDHLLPKVLGAFRSTYSTIRFRLLNRNFQGIDKSLSGGETDLALGWFDAVPDRWETVVLRTFCFVAVSRRGSARHLDEVLKGPQVTFEQGSGTRGWLEARLGPLPSVMELTGTESILRYVERGFGSAIVPDYCLSNARKQRLDLWSLEASLPTLELRMAWRRGSELSPAALLARDSLARAFR